MPASNAPYRKLTKTGKGSYYVVIPSEMVRRLGWKERQKLVVEQKARSVRIRDWAK